MTSFTPLSWSHRTATSPRRSVRYIIKKGVALKPFSLDVNDYDEIILGSPIWNSKGVPAINAFLKDEKAAAKVTSLFFLSGGGEIEKGLAAITKKLPNLKNTVSLLDKKHENSDQNDVKIKEFVEGING